MDKGYKYHTEILMVEALTSDTILDKQISCT